jgi:hypothetical protein
MIGTLTKTLKNILGITENKEIKCTIDELEVPLFECGPGHLTQGYGSFVGVPAPVVLPDDPWFGPSPIKSEKQMTHEEMLEEAQKREEENQQNVTKEPDNIHEVMYDMATKCGKTTTQLDPVGGSENFQGGSENIHG